MSSAPWTLAYDRTAKWHRRKPSLGRRSVTKVRLATLQGFTLLCEKRVKGRPACLGAETRPASGQGHAQNVLESCVVVDNRLTGGRESGNRRQRNRPDQRDVFDGRIAPRIGKKSPKRGEPGPTTQNWMSSEKHHTHRTQQTCQGVTTYRTQDPQCRLARRVSFGGGRVGFVRVGSSTSRLAVLR